MTPIRSKELTFPELLNAANKHYDENYLSAYFDAESGRYKKGSGDTLAEFIVRELRESFDWKGSRERRVSVAVRALERAKQDIQRAIDGLREL